MIAALLLLAIPIAPAQPKPIDTTIAALWADRHKFDGQVVRLHGWLNHCVPDSCDIEERPANSPGGPGESLRIFGDSKFYATVLPLLPTYIEVDARFSGGCRWPANINPPPLITCPDRLPMLNVVQLRGVIDPTTPPPED